MSLYFSRCMICRIYNITCYLFQKKKKVIEALFSILLTFFSFFSTQTLANYLFSSFYFFFKFFSAIFFLFIFFHFIFIYLFFTLPLSSLVFQTERKQERRKMAQGNCFYRWMCNYYYSSTWHLLSFLNLSKILLNVQLLYCPNNSYCTWASIPWAKQNNNKSYINKFKI